jgi:hypothetical protein
MSLLYASFICCLIAVSLITLRTIAILLLYLRLFALSLKSASLRLVFFMKSACLLKAFALMFSVPFWYVILKLYYANVLDYLVCLWFNFLVIVK